MTEVNIEYSFDAFGNKIESGDEVVYVLGDKGSKRLVKGILERIGHNEERTFGKTRYYIRPTADPFKYGARHKDGSLSPMEAIERIMKI